MRRVSLLLAIASVAIASPAVAKPSNPAFLGIGMHDTVPIAPHHVPGPCVVDSITRGSGAKAAGLRPELLASDLA